MLKIYLARHGQDEDEAAGLLAGRHDPPLTSDGIRAIQDLTRTIWSAGLHFDAIYTSPLQRSKQVATALADTLELPQPIERAQLTERDFGVMTGKHFADIEEMCAPDIITSATTTYFLKADGAETFPELIARSRMALNIVRKDHPDGTVLIVSHPDVCKMLFAAYYGLEWQPVLSMFHLPAIELLELSAEASAATARVAAAR